jgi:hypothetical protein
MKLNTDGTQSSQYSRSTERITQDLKIISCPNFGQRIQFPLWFKTRQKKNVGICNFKKEYLRFNSLKPTLV